MRVAGVLAACLLLLGCREVNPDFDANAGTEGSTDTDMVTGTVGSATMTMTMSASASSSPATSEGPSTGSGMTTMDPTDPMTSDSSGEPAECGNDQIDMGEDCDGTAIGSTCDDLGEPGGGLACADDCTFDPSDCACGTSQSVIGGDCPAECTGDCDGTICTIDCTGNGTCADADIACPTGWDCRVDCDFNSCTGATVTCGPQACLVQCDGGSACDGLTVDCGAGVCSVDCGNGFNVCENLVMNCGPNNSSIDCSHSFDAVTANAHDGSSCSCDLVDCGNG